MPCLEPKHCVHVGLIQYAFDNHPSITNNLTYQSPNITCSVAHPSMKVLPTTQIPAGATTLGRIAGNPVDKHGLIGSVKLCRMPMHATTTCSHDDDDSPTCTQRPIMPNACQRRNAAAIPTTQHSCDSDDATCPHSQPCTRAPPPTHHNDAAAAHVPPRQSFTILVCHGLAKDQLRLVYNQLQQIHKNIETETKTAQFGGNWQPKSGCNRCTMMSRQRVKRIELEITYPMA
ncbi:hypothetical protein BU15DRAFT_68993 [Melanogaster broomeanus]|nr:hypothetical protein BU15DRAFT_68993 [Melanogaster broomeanus]